MSTKVALLYSGGSDSTLCAAIAAKKVQRFPLPEKWFHSSESELLGYIEDARAKLILAETHAIEFGFKAILAQIMSISNDLNDHISELNIEDS